MNEIIDSLLDSFDYPDGRYKRQEVDLAVTLREEITPSLIGILEEVATHPSLYCSGERDGHLYAAALLAHFEEPEAHLPLIRAFTIPEEYLEEVWGDMSTRSLPAFLLKTSDGSYGAIKDLVLDKSADDYVRCSAAEALTYAVARGVADKEEVVSFLVSLLNVGVAGESGPLWDVVISDLADLHAVSAADVIKKAFADGHAWAGFASLDEIEADLAEDEEEVLARLRERADRFVPADVHDYLSWIERSEESRQMAGQGLFKTQKNKKKSNRAKNKMARKSKKKNRK